MTLTKACLCNGSLAQRQALSNLLGRQCSTVMTLRCHPRRKLTQPCNFVRESRRWIMATSGIFSPPVLPPSTSKSGLQRTPALQNQKNFQEFHSSSSSATPLLDEYNKLVDTNQVHPDEHQKEALAALERLRKELLAYDLTPPDSTSPTTATSESSSGGLSSWFGMGSATESAEASTRQSNLSPPQGVYLHGGVGSGKTMLMNLFYDSLANVEPWKSERQKIHYHKFMATIHAQMHKARNKLQGQHVSDAVLPAVIRETAKQGRLLCLDEFQVTDVADALILQRLFTGLWRQEGCIVVATSNRAPVDLYLGGLQRDRFLPFIDLLQESCQEVSMWDSAVDYRLIQKVESGQVPRLWFVGKDGLKNLDELVNDELVGPRQRLKPLQLKASAESKRVVSIPEASLERGLARFRFSDVCQTAMGASDYLLIGQHFSTVVVDQIPTLTLNEINWVRRFILLVDALYESNVKLILQTQEAPEAIDIFQVADKENAVHDEVFAFDRTVSRLQEMTSRSYLRKKWTGRKKSKSQKEKA